jgi:hypothetical protein
MRLLALWNYFFIICTDCQFFPLKQSVLILSVSWNTFILPVSGSYTHTHTPTPPPPHPHTHTHTHTQNNNLFNHFWTYRSQVLKKQNRFGFTMLWEFCQSLQHSNQRVTANVIVKRVESQICRSVWMCLAGRTHTHTPTRIIFISAYVAFSDLSHITYCSEMRYENSCES